MKRTILIKLWYWLFALCAFGLCLWCGVSLVRGADVLVVSGARWNPATKVYEPDRAVLLRVTNPPPFVLYRTFTDDRGTWLLSTTNGSDWCPENCGPSTNAGPWMVVVKVARRAP